MEDGSYFSFREYHEAANNSCGMHELWNATVQIFFNRFTKFDSQYWIYVNVCVQVYVYNETHTHTLNGCAQTIVQKP